MAAEDFEEILRIQQLMSQRIIQEQRTDRKIEFLNTINELTESQTRVQTEAVLVEAQMSDITEAEALKLLDELERDHLIKRADGFVSRA